MENLVPLGTGNSRFMKSNISPSTTLAQLIQMLNSGTFPYDIGPINPAGISQQGDPINKDTLLKDATAGLYGLGSDAVPDDVLKLLDHSVQFYSSQTPKYQEVTVDLSTVQEGDIVRLPENGVLVDFYVAKLNYESTLNGTGRVLVVRKDVYDRRVWDLGRRNGYASSDIDTFLNGAYKNLLGTDIQASIGTTEFYYTPGEGNSTVTTLSRSVFLLSAKETGGTGSNISPEGSLLPIVDLLSPTYSDGTFANWWTRTPVLSGTTDVWANYGDTGGAHNSDADALAYSRPAFTLPSTFTATYYVDSSGNLHDEQEYDEAGSTTDVKGNPITIGAQIATGSYVGTGTYGASNPNTLTFEFEPKFIFIAAVNSSYWGLFNTLILSSEYDSPGYAVLGGNPIVNTSSMAKLDKNTNTLSWYLNGSNVSLQLNSSGITYHYVSIG